MKRITFAAVAIALAIVPLTNASMLSKALLNTEKTVNKAVKDTNAEVDRSKEKLLKAGTSNGTTTPTASATPIKPLVERQVADEEIDKLGEKLKDTRAEKIEVEGEKKLADAIVVALTAAIVGGIITMGSTGMFGRYDRREKFLAAVEREWNLQSQGFDFASIPTYRRLSQPAKNAGASVQRQHQIGSDEAT
jgi:hypothetical protein